MEGSKVATTLGQARHERIKGIGAAHSEKRELLSLQPVAITS